MLPIYLTDEELFALYLCTMDSDSSSSDEDDDEGAQDIPANSSINSKKHDW
jgi:hypothetical protein